MINNGKPKVSIAKWIKKGKKMAKERSVIRSAIAIYSFGRLFQ